MSLGNDGYVLNTYEFGYLRILIYDFPEVGGTLPMHCHKLGGAHISVVARGSFNSKGSGWEKSMPLGSVIDWDENQWHEFVALEPDSRLVNVVKQDGYL